MRVYIFIVFILGGLFNVNGQATFEKAQYLTGVQSFDASSEILVAFINEHPQRKYDVARAWWLHSYNLLAKGLIKEASLANETSLELRKALRSTDAASNYLRQAEIEMVAKEFDEALNSALQGMQMMIEDAVLYAQLNMMCAKALTASEHYDEAQEYMNTALDILAIDLSKKHALYAEYAIDAGYLSLTAGAFDAARQHFQEAYWHGSPILLRSIAYFFAVARY